MLGFLFVSDDVDFAVDPDDAAKLLDAAGVEIVQAAYGALTSVGDWNTASIEAALRVG